MELKRHDLDSLHDTIFEALGIESKSDKEILEYWNKLPRNIQLDAEKWGLSDTVVRDDIYVWLQENK